MSFLVVKKPRAFSLAVFKKPYEQILGTKYSLCIVFVSSKKIAELNRRYRKKNGATDILAFPMSRVSGEIYLCLSEVASHAQTFGMTRKAHLPFLLVHGMLHLKGYRHGAVMERLEAQHCKMLGFSHPQFSAQAVNPHKIP